MRDRNAPLSADAFDALAWAKMDGLLPAIVQDGASGRVLMLGYMDRAALAATLETRRVTFFSRSRQRLWTKGESSGNLLNLVAVHEDCDGDALLVIADPVGPTCHEGTASCFGGSEPAGPAWLAELSAIVAARAGLADETSYTRKLLARGPERIAQKIGEEGVEIALAAVTRDNRGIAEETADLLYHLAVLFEAKGMRWEEVVAILRERHAERSSATASS
ncbi:bifunctional phosphoribosyl-AMP cyclohydrolase/phosphoribosyl-ATP diphosphatase HisIE [Sphingomonas ginkgonis]|uniref:Histidine biosynthesis bifunctional protein HisIE n=1 Tax=Sphingomonas ginkgonis TaxID=2315330 RepID=A0A429V6E1_9SPHN|nr:bifunctional phosphoribosyl-AMP cyclohydrolase/phosphoribosyl-ATP diphosphatase HisIE [Sphingomonas ginkgonis]RST29494.1 bifunctional phosphoribosyl-AMP cyclohydrolase/phosphoribosyl-ATP diphosphatase HisIE [Sphingomonas ginkgonis]